MRSIPHRSQSTADLVGKEGTMKIIAGIILGICIGIAIAWTTSAMASPAQQGSTEERLQALEYLRWTEDHAVSAVGQRVWERVTSCEIDSSQFSCGGASRTADPVLTAFSSLEVNAAWQRFIALSAFHWGRWSATPNGDGDTWTVSVVVPVANQDGTTTEYGPISWKVWESNGYIEAAY